MKSMKSKKWLALLLTLCMMLSCLSPVAAATTGESTVTRPMRGTSTTVSETVGADSSAVSDDAALGSVVTGSESIGSIDADAEEIAKTDGARSNGIWSIEEIDSAELSNADSISALLSGNGASNDIGDIKALEDVYNATAMVTAFVVLEDEPLAASYSSQALVPDSIANVYVQKQEAVISAIRNCIDSAAEVVAQFEFLTNSVVVSTEHQNLSKIAELDGVASVFVSPIFYPAAVKGDAEKMTVSSGQMTNVDDVWALNGSGYTGKGMTIAILDTGLDLDHPSFAADPEGAAWTKEDVQKMIENNSLNAAEKYDGLNADYVYYSAKVPFIFNYSKGNNDVLHNDNLSDHGTHVAGIAAANAVEGTGVVGMAPDAQLIVMKVFNSTTGGASLQDYVDALEDCITMGVDVVNLSLGSAAGFSTSSRDEVDAIFERLADCGPIVNIAAGNESTSATGSLYGLKKALTSSIDNSTVSSPSTYPNVMSIASVDNEFVMGDYFTVGESKVFYQPSVEFLYGYTDIGIWELYAGETLDYVIIDGLGEEEDFYDEDGNSLVAGKVAVIERGTIAFSEKVYNAEAAGAIVAIIRNNDSDDIHSFGMTTEYEDETYPGIPAILVSMTDGEMMAEAETKTLTVAEDPALRINSTGGQISSFSSWGVSADLRLLPDLSGIGGNVYSCYDGGAYGLMSGTSMATPQVCGVTALVKQYITENEIESTLTSRELVEALMMSTANVIIDSDSDVETSPRQQGAGVVDALKAVTSGAYLTVNGGRPKAELGDNAEGTFSFTFEIHNFSDEAKTYTLSSSLLCEDYDFVNEYKDKYFMAGWDTTLDGEVEFSDDTVTVAAGETESVTVSITVSKDGKDWIEKYFPNGNYVEGYIYLTAEEGGVNMSLPFMGFCGDWSDAPIFDEGYWYDNSLWADTVEGVENSVTAEEYWHILWTSMGSSTQDWMLGLNPYSGMLADGNGNLLYSPDNNVLSPNGDGYMDQISDLFLALLRNARYVWLTYTDEDGEVLSQQTMEFESKTMYNSNYGYTIPSIYSWYYTDPLYDFEGCEDGDKITLTISAVIDYDVENKVDEDGELIEEPDDFITIPITIDLTKPELKSVQESYNGENRYLIVTFNEAHPATAALMNPAGTQLYDQVYDNTFVHNSDGTYTAMLDITDRGDDFMLVLGDYAYQESHYQISRETSGGNDPAVDTDALYAYKVYDLNLYYYYGWDYMFGWSTIDASSGEAEMINSDAYEYYALNAAEYVDGYVFAVDAGNNFLYMKPGLWNRNIIRNIGYNVIDMAFDDVSGTMYLAISDSASSFYGLATLDLLTGEVTLLRNYYSKYSAPWAMTFANGKLYCCKYYYNGFYEVNLETYDISSVTTADGEDFLPTTASGWNVSPYYGQSMTYSKADGKIYWLYCNSSSTSELIAIDPATWTCSAVSLGSTEYVGALTLEDTNYKIPASTEITALSLDQDTALIAEGEAFTPEAYILPWNAPADKLTWSSDNEDVATVDENGVVKGIGEGEAVITVQYGESISASCTVRVIALGSDVIAYDYSGDGDYGYWQSIDLTTMEPTDLVKGEIEIMAADYNGHDGYLYGVDSEKGNSYRIDRNDGSATLLGSVGQVADMAYDYSTGLMYAVTGTDTYLYALDMRSGTLVKLADMGYFMLATLACDMYGTLYGITYDGDLVMLTVYEGGGSSEGGGDEGVMPLDLDGDMGVDPTPGVGGDGTLPMSVEVTYIDELALATDGLIYGQSLCYDHNNTDSDVLIWSYTDGNTFRQIGLDGDDYGPYVDYDYDLGNTTTHAMPQYLGMHVIPEEIPELEEVELDSVTVSDMFLLVGSSAQPMLSLSPINTNVEYDYYYFFNMGYDVNWEEAEVIDIDTLEETGTIVAKEAGVAYVSFYVFEKDADLDEDAPVYGGDFKVTVKNPTASTLRSFFGDVTAWVNLDQHDTDDPTLVNYVTDSNGDYYFMYSAEYVESTDLIYGYGYNESAVDDWENGFYFMTFDPKTMKMTNLVSKGLGFPFVYDLAFDYSTGTMYALAGSDSVVALYYVDLSTGNLITACTLDGMYLNMAVDAEGTVYVISRAESSYDWESDTTVTSTSALYRVDVATGETEYVLDTLVSSTTLSSLSYDYDTGYLYWTPQGYLYLIDPADYSCNKLGITAGDYGDYHALMLLADKYPEVPAALVNATITTSLIELHVDDTQALSLFVQPSTVDASITWSSDDETVATVDQSGVVTAKGVGKAVVSATVSAGGTTVTATCTVLVYGAGDYFLSYNVTDKGFSAIDRLDPSKVTNLTENEDASPVSAMTMLDDGTIYAYDEDGNFFTTSVADNFKRNYLGNHGIDLSDLAREDVTEEYWGTVIKYHYEPQFVVQDMTVYNGELLAVGTRSYHVSQEVTYEGGGYSDDYIAELEGGCVLYSVDIATGKLTKYSDIPAVDGDGGTAPGVKMLTSANGKLYYYYTMRDYVCLFDVESGTGSIVANLQSLTVYGDEDSVMAMSYDEDTNRLYLLLTTNGRFYCLLSVNLETASISELGNIDTVVYDEDNWVYNGDIFHGLITVSGAEPTTTPVTPVTPVTPSKPSNPSTPSTPEKNTLPFVDVAEGEWYYDAVKYVYEKGLMNGVGDGTHFDPDGEVTRAMVVQTLYRMAGSPAVSGSNGFTDLSNDWYLDAVQWAYANGITTGRTETTFAPDEHVTREELATFFYRYAAFCGCDVSAAADLSSFVDADELGVWAQSAMSWANAKGLILGRGANTLAPKGNAARSELATILMRFRETIA